MSVVMINLNFLLCSFLLKYSVNSIKHTVLLKVLLQIFLLVSIKSTVHWSLSRQIYFFVLSLLKILFSIFQKNSIFNRKKSQWKVKCTVRLIESTEYLFFDPQIKDDLKTYCTFNNVSSLSLLWSPN